jgi:hypothetical protein
MKWIVEFLKHDGGRGRTMPFDSERAAEFAATAIRLTLAPFTNIDPNPVVLMVAEDMDLQGVEK